MLDKREIVCDLCVVGGGLAGMGAAIAAALGCAPTELLFTASGSEGNCALYVSGRQRILIDAGKNTKYINDIGLAWANALL